MLEVFEEEKARQRDPMRWTSCPFPRDSQHLKGQLSAFRRIIALGASGSANSSIPDWALARAA